jgi:hypothetical protein
MASDKSYRSNSEKTKFNKAGLRAFYEVFKNNPKPKDDEAWVNTAAELDCNKKTIKVRER